MERGRVMGSEEIAQTLADTDRTRLLVRTRASYSPPAARLALLRLGLVDGQWLFGWGLTIYALIMVPALAVLPRAERRALHYQGNGRTTSPYAASVRSAVRNNAPSCRA
jgi:hypothetical protein